MPRVSIYLTQQLHRRLTEAGLPVTKICQSALADALSADDQTIADQLRAEALRLMRIAEETERRTRASYERFTAHGVDVDSTMDGTPYLREHYRKLMAPDGGGESGRRGSRKAPDDPDGRRRGVRSRPQAR